MKEAMFYKELEMKVVQCELCPNYCKIAEGKKGYCQVRVNVSGKLYTETYNQYSSIAIDPIEKKPLYHFYPGQQILSLGSIGCNFRCKHCQNSEISQPFRSKFKRFLDNIIPEQINEMTIKKGLHLLAFTYNEPLINIETIISTSKALKKRGIHIVLVTNGFINSSILKELNEIIDAYSIDIKAFNIEKYVELTGVDAFEVVKNNIEVLVKANKHVELVTNLVTGINDEEKQIIEAAKWIYELNPNIPWHLSTFRPMLDYNDKAPINRVFVTKAIKYARAVGLKNVYGRDEENTMCQNCRKLLISRQGFNVIENNLDRNVCRFCNYTVPGLTNDWYKSNDN